MDTQETNETTGAKTFRYSRTTMVKELRRYGAKFDGGRVPRGEWERLESDRLAELAVGAH